MLYNHTHHGHTAPPPIYSTLAEEGAPADYSTIVDKEAPAGEYSEIQQPAPDTSNEGLVYSAVVVKDGKKTTVKTMAQHRMNRPAAHQILSNLQREWSTVL